MKIESEAPSTINFRDVTALGHEAWRAGVSTRQVQVIRSGEVWTRSVSRMTEFGLGHCSCDLESS